MAMVYKRYIKRGGKTFGPYYYESYRDAEGRTHSRFLGGPEYRKRKAGNMRLFLVLGIGVLLIAGLLVLNFGFGVSLSIVG